MEITVWARESFQKSLPLNTVHSVINKCWLKLYHAKNPINEHDPDHHLVLGAKANF